MFLQNDHNWLRSTLSRSYSQYVEDTAEYRYVTDFELDHQPRTKSLSQVLTGHSWPKFDHKFCSSQTSNYVEDEPNPRQPSFAFRDFYSGRRWYDPFYNVKCVENYFPWSIFKFLVGSIKNGDQTQARAAGCRCDGKPTSKRQNKTIPIQVLPYSCLSIISNFCFTFDHSSQ